MPVDYLCDEAEEVVPDDGVIGKSGALRRVLRQVELVAATEASVLIQGESGTGKELFARAIHRRSPRASRALVKVNCASIPKDLFESEFFGHVRGAFTGAVGDRVGRFQLADRGTLFLDEVGEIPLDLQTMLLRVAQEGEFERVGKARLGRCPSACSRRRTATCGRTWTPVASDWIFSIASVCFRSMSPPCGSAARTSPF